MKPALYVETSVVGYYTGRPSRDLIVAGRQQVTRDWWENERLEYSLYISALVLQECQCGEPEAVKRREQALKGIPLLGTMDQTEELAEALVKNGPIPAQYPEDALHIALASTNGMDYLLTWNFRHINNARMKSDVARIIGLFGYDCPMICTPEELLEIDYEDAGSHT
jgi:predicted nucleic acid-binding protein